MARQKKRRPDEILGLPDSAERYLLRFGVELLFVFDMRFRLRRIDRAGTDTVDRDPVRRELERQRFGKADDAALGSRVVSAMLVSLQRSAGGKIDDAPGSVMFHCRHHRAATKKSSAEIRAQHLL